MLLYGLILNVILHCDALFYPIKDFNDMINVSPPEDQISFHLYHYTNISVDDVIIINNENSIEKSRFDSELPTKVLIHGWTHGKDILWVREMREAMANTRLWNVIVVHWAPLSHAIYFEARLHTPVVAKQVANMIMTIKKFKGTNMSDVHIIGHSMGAQIAAYAAFKIRELSNDTVGRITGLDPAAPLYEWPHTESLDEVIDPSDAAFVDIIHTNARHLGMVSPSGHVDYYPNGGENQPGCAFWICSHQRAVDYWTASVKNPDLFHAYPYHSWDEYLSENVKKLKSYPMGIAASKSIPAGIYYLEVGNEFRQYLTSVNSIDDSWI